MNYRGERIRETFSYFSLTPYGYANVGPLITAVLTCVLILLIVVSWIKYSKGLKLAIMIISGIATATSLMPLLFGFDNMSVIGIFITYSLASILGVSFIKRQ